MAKPKKMSIEKLFKIWEKIQIKGMEINLDFDIETYNKLVKMIYMGKSYYWMCDNGNHLFNISDDCMEVTGFNPAELTFELFVERIHPEDLPYFIKFEQEAVNFFSELTPDKVLCYKTTYDIRFRRKDETYIRLLQQVLPNATTMQGGIARSFGIHTDITEYKPTGIPTFSILGLNGEPSYYNINSEVKIEDSSNTITKREREVLVLLMSGLKTDEIANKLFISKFTVQNHRKNMLYKTNSSTSAELISHAIKEGWV